MGASWQDTTQELIRSLLDNILTARSADVRRRCAQSIEAEVTRLALDSAALHRERLRFDDAAETALDQLRSMDREARDLRAALAKADERAAALEARGKDLRTRLAEAERTAARLAPDEGCRERLVEAMRQLDEETKARQQAEVQVRGPLAPRRGVQRAAVRRGEVLFTCIRWHASASGKTNTTSKEPPPCS